MARDVSITHARKLDASGLLGARISSLVEALGSTVRIMPAPGDAESIQRCGPVLIVDDSNLRTVKAMQSAASTAEVAKDIWLPVRTGITAINVISSNMNRR
ncbi:uncharacterized protein LDX57_010733 [Aspergillus melleus]|uniref:uncharacterized protein n=1 Tax=Aspergillus melleus TaxID=138277 RepID=UPI001E8D8DBC|nr:uncharacterized protein LDX57_010733 [Aspergillus melleus]KAH8433099.1 hypothetical protein LDX57_010733 [Aspergillus melleus]